MPMRSRRPSVPLSSAAMPPPPAHAPHSDAALWDVLARVGLKDTVAALPGGLDAGVSELGENFSQGQRQLICLARVLLRRAAVLLLDEASSSLDHASDVALQAAIRESFGGSATIITIAHRLNTIIDSDRILVMDAGKVRRTEWGSGGGRGGQLSVCRGRCTAAVGWWKRIGCHT